MNDDATRMRPAPATGGDPSVTDEPTRAAAPASDYSFYRTQQGAPVHDAASPYGASPTGAQAGFASEPPARSNRTPIIAGVVAGAVILAAIGIGTALGRGGDKKTNEPSTVAVSNSTVPQQQAPSTTPPSNPPGTSGANPPATAQSGPTTAQSGPTTEPAAVQSAAPQQSTPASQAPGSSTAAPTFDPTSLPGYVESVDHNGTQYAMTREGTTVTIYADDAGNAAQQAQFQLSGPPDMSAATTTHLELVSLPGCSRPTVVFNAKADQGSGAFGWDGSTYQAYKAMPGEHNMRPVGGNGAGNHTFGVTLEGNTIAFREDRGIHAAQGNHFSSCTGTSGSVDELQQDGQ